MDDTVLTTIWKTTVADIWWTRNDGLWASGSNWCSIGNPGREVVCVSGDGGFQMNSQEIATAVIQELPITICILNNGYLGMVRQWQDLFYDKAYAGTCLRRRKSCEHHCDGDFSKMSSIYTRFCKTC